MGVAKTLLDLSGGIETKAACGHIEAKCRREAEHALPLASIVPAVIREPVDGPRDEAILRSIYVASGKILLHYLDSRARDRDSGKIGDIFEAGVTIRLINRRLEKVSVNIVIDAEDGSVANAAGMKQW